MEVVPRRSSLKHRCWNLKKPGQQQTDRPRCGRLHANHTNWCCNLASISRSNSSWFLSLEILEGKCGHWNTLQELKRKIIHVMNIFTPETLIKVMNSTVGGAHYYLTNNTGHLKDVVWYAKNWIGQISWLFLV